MNRKLVAITDGELLPDVDVQVSGVFSQAVSMKG